MQRTLEGLKAGGGGGGGKLVDRAVVVISL